MGMSYVCLAILGLAAGASFEAVVYGPRLGVQIFDSLQQAFSLAYDSDIAYSEVGTTPLLQSHLNSGDLVITESIADLEIPSTSVVVPLLGYPMVVIYDNSVADDGLVFTQRVLMDIFNGKITHWNDENITSLNPNNILPNAPITFVMANDTFTTDFFEGLASFFPDEDVNSTYARSIAVYVPTDELCDRVDATFYSFGVAYMQDVLTASCQVGFLQNRDGFMASAYNGVPDALEEYRVAQEANTSVTLLPHNMPGRLSWPLVGILSLIVPQSVPNCLDLQVITNFVDLLLYQPESERLVKFLGWQPASVLLTQDDTLGTVIPRTHKQLSAVTCPSGSPIDPPDHGVASSTSLWSFVLKLLVAYAPTDTSLVLQTDFNNITTYLDAMILDSTTLDVDVTMTWQPVINLYPDVNSVPVFMGAVVVITNLGIVVNLDVPTVVGIFTGVITWWNDTQIQDLNPTLLLPQQQITVIAAAQSAADSVTNVFASLLQSAIPSFSWSQVTNTSTLEFDIVPRVDFTNFSIGYSFAHELDPTAQVEVPNLVNAANRITDVSNLSTCFYATSRDCFPLAVPLVMAVRKPGAVVQNLTCAHQQLAVQFVAWVRQNTVAFQNFIVPHPDPTALIGAAEFCGGRSLLRTIPEPQQISQSAMTSITVLCILGMLWTVFHMIALFVARKHTELRSASVLFSFLSVVGLFLILITPLLIVQNTVNTAQCTAAVWVFVWGFSLTYASLFAKLFRLYKIFTSRSLIVPRMGNRKMIKVVGVFLLVDFVLLIIYTALNAPAPAIYDSYVPYNLDLVTGQRHLQWTMCSFYVDSPMLLIILISKLLVAVTGAGLAFVTRQVDRKYSSTTALGWSFYNMFFTIVIAAIVLVFFHADADQTLPMFVLAFCGLWITFVTMVALAVDSNLLLATKKMSAKFKEIQKNSRENSVKDQPNKKNSKEDSKEKDGEKQSQTSTILVVNREMFPSKYEDFDVEFLNQILDELNYQRAAVRKALLNSGGNVTETFSDRTRPSVQIELATLPKVDGTPRLESRHRDSKLNLVPISRNHSKSDAKPESPHISHIADGDSMSLDSPQGDEKPMTQSVLLEIPKPEEKPTP